MSLDQQGETNGNYKPPNLIREEVLRLHSRRDQIGNEIKEYQDILRSVRFILNCCICFQMFKFVVYLG